jgi:bifunctional N-acetylglucosamine-1-phosphate-uridyltransferase/glucosamine-1-phosphate-acetyltransferase GlmU-like protein
MAVGEVEAWNIIIGAVVAPLTTLGAATITAAGSVLMANVMADAFKASFAETVKQQTDIQRSLIENIPHPKFF